MISTSGRQDVDRLCSCGLGKETVEHVSWECLEYAEERGAVVSQLRVDLEQFPVCFRYAAVVLQDFVLSDHERRLVQIFLEETWRCHIIRWYSGGDLEQMARVQRRQLTDEGVVENGHLLAPREQGGFWCRLCGKHTAWAKHVRLKITRQPCANQGGEILAREGFYHNDNRLDQLERELNTRYSLGKHLLHWNRRTGKELGSQEEGWLQCLRSCCMGGSGIASAGRRIFQKTPLSRLSRAKYFPARCDPAVLFAEVPAGELIPRAGVG